MKTKVTTHHLEMLSPADLRAPRETPAGAQVSRAEVPSPELNRFLYMVVGGDWYWIDRLSWSRDRWVAWLDRPELETWVGYLRGTPFGYFELESQSGGNVEIAYFGILPQFTGKKLGGWLLAAAARRGWDMGAKRVWVHTCTLDSPAALPNYKARGFRVFKEEVALKDLPERSPGVWPASG